MDHHRGKMFRQYECQHCGATFSKRSLLDEHKRILGHQEVFRCRVCDKGFYRKSNLESHERKHSSSEFYQCDKCKKVFSHPDRLSLHKENSYNQSGGGVKRKSTQDGLPIKRKVTKYDDPSDSYTISVVGTQKMPKFNTTSTRYKVAFRELDVRGIPNILKSLRVLFNSIIKDITKFMEPDDLVRLSVQCPELDFPISLPFMKLSQLNAERFLTEIERVLQSYEQFVMDETLEIEFIQVSMPVGGIGKRCRYVDLEKTLEEKRCFIRVQNKDNLCCARAIVTAKARLDNHEKWNSIRVGRHIQRDLALQLHDRASVPLGKCGIPEIKRFQEVMPEYQIYVLSKGHFNAIIYEGPEADKKMYLYLHDDHYDVITKMPAFLGRNYYCTICNKGYDHKERHACNDTCHHCYKIHDVHDEHWKYCEDCNRYFRNDICFDLHKQRSNSGQSTCTTNFRCNQCGQSVYAKLHKKPHLCGEQYCRVCKDYFPESHQCYMVPEEKNKDNKNCLSESTHELNISTDHTSLPKEKSKTFLFFDFECRQEELLQCERGFTASTEGRKCIHCKQSWCGTRKHTPNLCVVHKVCEICMTDEVDSGTHCEKCGQNEYIFRGETTRDDFCRWLFSEENSGAKVLCHNFKGYDSYPILQYLYQNGVLPEVIKSGSKFMSIDIPKCNIRFIDSINFLPMSLEKFPKSFGLKELCKGYFPHLMNTNDNQNAILQGLPDMKYYNPDGMKPDKRREFMEWYNEHKYDTFNFQEQLLAYCKSDVDILRKGCLAFRKMFMEVTSLDDKPGVDPFDKCLTIASACNLVFRRNFLEYDSIGIIPPNGYRPQQKQSIKALKWLQYISEKDSIEIVHARNGGEKRIGPFLVDGYQETLDGDTIVYEFHGCFWHACPKCFAKSTMNPVTGTSMSDLYQRTLDKRSFLEKNGYKYICIWECEFDKEVESNMDLNKYMKSHTMHYPLEPREAFYGGRTEAFTMYKEAAKDESINYYDVTSLYPFINKTGKIPLGHPLIITENFKNIDAYEGLVKCKINPPRNLYLPVLPSRIKGKLMFGLCRTCMEDGVTENCCHNVDSRALTGTWVSDEIKKAVEKGYEIEEIYEVWHFENVSQYDPLLRQGGVFTEYVNTFLKIKQEASGWPDWCKTEEDRQKYTEDYFEKEGIRLDAKNINCNPGLRQLAKLMLNR